jgi:hypothetical protein
VSPDDGVEHNRHDPSIHAQAVASSAVVQARRRRPAPTPCPRSPAAQAAETDRELSVSVPWSTSMRGHRPGHDASAGLGIDGVFSAVATQKRAQRTPLLSVVDVDRALHRLDKGRLFDDWTGSRSSEWDNWSWRVVTPSDWPAQSLPESSAPCAVHCRLEQGKTCASR